MATRPFIVIGDKTDHGGEVVSGSPTTTTGGKMIARVGDQVTCPKHGHGPTTSVTGDDTMLIDGKAAARHGDLCGCGAMLIASQMVSFTGDGGNAAAPTAGAAATDDAIAKDAGMSSAVQAARNALAGGPDKSNGAYFWDGADIKTNYANHPKVLAGIRFSDPAHNIYDIKESTRVETAYNIIAVRNRKTGITKTKKVKLGSYDHKYESTAAYGGTIFWKLNPEYVKLTHAKEYK